MSKYQVQYYSESKRESLDIEAMPSPHIANALRKIGDDAEMKEVRRAMWAELTERGCTFDQETGQWTFPERTQP